jgi:hypothetical protein
VSQTTDARIKELCAEAVNVKNTDDVERVLSELRLALTSHITSARSSLKPQAARLSERGHLGKQEQPMENP